MVIKLTNECNLNCFYCKKHDTEEVHPTEAEIHSMVKQAAETGDSWIELAGGEPLLYPKIEELVRNVKKIPGVKKVTVTTNGILLSEKLSGLQKAGIDGINIHIDSGDAWTYAKITGKEMVMNEVLSGMWSALAKDIPVTISIMMHEHSKDSFVVLASFAKKLKIDIRFVYCGGFTGAVGLNEENVIKKLSRHFPDLHMVQAHVYQSSMLKGRILFADHLTETV